MPKASANRLISTFLDVTWMSLRALGHAVQDRVRNAAPHITMPSFRPSYKVGLHLWINLLGSYNQGLYTAKL